MVYIDPAELGWSPYVRTWMKEHGSKLKEETRDYILELFDTYVDEGLKFVRKKCTEAIAQVLCVQRRRRYICLGGIAAWW